MQEIHNPYTSNCLDTEREREIETALEGEISIPNEVLNATDAELHKWLMEYSNHKN